jgi:hypothetical protein
MRTATKLVHIVCIFADIYSTYYGNFRVLISQSIYTDSLLHSVPKFRGVYTDSLLHSAPKFRGVYTQILYYILHQKIL